MGDNKPDVVVVIPLYRENLSETEEKSFRRSCAVFDGKYPVVAFAPEKMDLSTYTKIFPNLEVEFFPAEYFRSIGDYSRLLLSEEFYERFSMFQWLLICQLDVWVFRDELDYWCSREIDYLGAPIPACWDPGIPKNLDRYIVGNGGYSLRRISSILKVLRAGDSMMYTRGMLWRFFLSHLRSGHLIKGLVPLIRMLGVGNKRKDCLRILRKQGACEDMVFRTIAASGIEPSLMLPSVEEAARFAWDGESAWHFFCQSSNIPMALHAWHRIKEDELIKQLWEKYGELCSLPEWKSILRK